MNLVALMEISTLYDEDYYFIWKDAMLDTRIDKDTLITQILRACSDSYPLYTTVATFKDASDAFFKKWSYQISKLLDTQDFEYNPIWNKDGDIYETRTNDRNRNEKVDDDFNEQVNENNSSTNENEVSAYNSSSYQPHDKDSRSEDLGRHTDAGRDISTNETEKVTEDYHRREQGNIGITTTQQMINEERGLYEFNIYEWVVKKYANELFLNVW